MKGSDPKVVFSHTQQVSSGFWQVSSAPSHMVLSILLLEFPHNMAIGYPQGVIEERR
jgi:hypothetical protein